MQKSTTTNYRKFRPSKLNTPEFSHLKMLIFWPIYGLMFLFIERFWIRDYYFPIYSPVDDMIPFCEYFLIPYLFWFVYLVGMLFYTLLFDVESYKKFMKFIMITYSTAMLIYIIFPNCQELRPMTFERNNIFTKLLTAFYQYDTNTNVCPSIHVIGSVAVMLCAWHSKRFNSIAWRILFLMVTILISASTLFLKQHSIWDVIVAIPICIIAYFMVYKRKNKSIRNN